MPPSLPAVPFSLPAMTVAIHKSDPNLSNHMGDLPCARTGTRMQFIQTLHGKLARRKHVVTC